LLFEQGSHGSSRKLQFFEVKITVGNHFYGGKSKKDKEMFRNLETNY
jgi:hypothetical protein